MILPFIIISTILLITAVVVGLYLPNKSSCCNGKHSVNGLIHGSGKPIIWLFYDTEDVNSRHWLDFSARSERALNMPFLNLCYKSIVEHNTDLFHIEVIGGLSGVAELLGGWEKMPSGLQNPLKPIRDRELNWIRSAILSKYGGLWLSPYSIQMRGFGTQPADKIIFFGTDFGESYSGGAGTAVPGFRCIWSPKPEMGVFVDWEQICRARLDHPAGGQEIRRDENWDYIALATKYHADIGAVNVGAEGARKEGGRRLEIEDLLASGNNDNLSFSLSNSVIYVPIPWRELQLRKTFGWFLRMSETQIMESDLTVRHLLCQ